MGRLGGVGTDYEAAGVELANLLEHRPDIVEPVVNERVRAYSYLAMMRRILRRFDINVIIDAGAHSGQFAGSMYGFCGFQGRVYSFEPVEEFFRVLQSNTGYHKGWQAHHLAVGDIPGPSTVWVGGGHGGTSSLLKGNDLFVRYIPDCVLGHGQQIEVVRLDEFLDSTFREPDNRIMLKSDTQGFEKRVLQSCGSFLSRVDLLHIEVSSVPVYEGQESMAELLTFIEEAGFVTIYVANNYAPEPGIYIDYDVVCANRTRLQLPAVEPASTEP